MFDGVAKNYDRTNSILSMGNAWRWRTAMVHAIAPQPGERILDLAAGTGTSSAALAKTGATVVAADFSPGHDRRGPPQASGHRPSSRPTPLPCRSPTANSTPSPSRFGLRNVEDPKQVLAEMFRVLKPEGRMVICEFSKPPRALLRVGLLGVPALRHAGRRHHREFESRGLSLPRRLDRPVARPDHPDPVDQGCRIHPGRVPQPHRRRRRAASRTEARDDRRAHVGGQATPRESRCEAQADQRKQRPSEGPQNPDCLSDRSAVDPVNMSLPHARRGDSLISAISLGEKLFSTASERRFADKLEQGLRAVEAGLMREMTFADSLADVTSRYLLDAGGKRVRPTLTLLTAQLGKGNTPEVIIAAQAMEITHLASLYHDDVMDEAELRRGVPSAQTRVRQLRRHPHRRPAVRPGRQLVAGLGSAAIGLQARTFERLVPRPAARDDRAAVRRGPDRALPAGARGQDRFAHRRRRRGRRRLLRRAAKSTGSRCSTFGEKIGVAFQLIDDVIDLSGGGRARPARRPEPTCAPAWRPSRCSTCAGSRQRMPPPPTCVDRIDTEVDTAGPAARTRSPRRSPSCASTR